MNKAFFYCFLLVGCLTSAQAQVRDLGKGFGLQMGISMSFGSHVSRVGFSAQLYYTYRFFQTNLRIGGWYCGETMGSEKPTFEGQVKLGVLAGWGKTDSLTSPFFNEVSNQTNRRFAIGYSYNLYLTQIGTSQCTGILGIHFKDVLFLFENDFLAFQSQDKYKTGSVGLYYRYRNTQMGLYLAAWTGDPYKNTTWIKQDRKGTPSAPFKTRYGYMDMTGAPYGNKSVGILAASFQQYIPNGGQYLDAHIGIDAEQVRNSFQNKFIHDSPVLPINWGKNGNPHIPMVADDGTPFLYKPGQKIRPAKFFMQLGWNSPTWY